MKVKNDNLAGLEVNARTICTIAMRTGRSACLIDSSAYYVHTPSVYTPVYPWSLYFATELNWPELQLHSRGTSQRTREALLLILEPVLCMQSTNVSPECSLSRCQMPHVICQIGDFGTSRLVKKSISTGLASHKGGVKGARASLTVRWTAPEVKARHASCMYHLPAFIAKRSLYA